MLAHCGQEYHLSKKGDVFGNVVAGLRTQFSFDFDLETDTISFSDWKHFEHFTRHYELFSSDELRPMRSSAVKSITLEHIEIQELDIKDITYYAEHLWIDVGIQRSGRSWTGAGALISLLSSTSSRISKN
jgi:hypothetical protein